MASRRSISLELGGCGTGIIVVAVSGGEKGENADSDGEGDSSDDGRDDDDARDGNGSCTIRRALMIAASFRNRLSPEATDSRLRIWVAGCENGCESRDVIRYRRSLRFLQHKVAVFGPSMSVTERRRFRQARGGAAGSNLANAKLSESG